MLEIKKGHASMLVAFSSFVLVGKAVLLEGREEGRGRRGVGEEEEEEDKRMCSLTEGEM